jgi:hypothetical protein
VSPRVVAVGGKFTVGVTRALGLLSRSPAPHGATLERLRTLGAGSRGDQPANPTASKNDCAPKSSKLIGSLGIAVI